MVSKIPSLISKIVSDLCRDRFKAVLLIALTILFAILIIRGESTFPGRLQGAGEVHFFFHPQCPHCKSQQAFNEKLRSKYPDFQWIEHDISRSDEGQIFESFARHYGIAPEQLGVPATFVADRYLIGFEAVETSGDQIEAMLREKIVASEGGPAVESSPGPRDPEIRLPWIGIIDIRGYSLGGLAVVLGLVDGFNPCAMWVLVYLISLILALKDRSKVWCLVGSFVFASGLLYFLFLTAWLNAFLLIGYLRPISLLVGVFALGRGIYQLKEFFLGGPIVCTVTEPVERSKTLAKVSEIVRSPLSLASLAGILILAFTVNSIEFICSAGIPAVFTHLLAITPISAWQHYVYLLLYTFFFMLDDLVIFGLAAFAAQSSLGERYARWGKLMGGLLLLALGLLLVFYPQVLR